MWDDYHVVMNWTTFDTVIRILEIALLLLTLIGELADLMSRWRR